MRTRAASRTVSLLSLPVLTFVDGQQIFTGTIDGRKGAVCMRARGTHVGEWSIADWDFVTETAT